MRGGWSPLGPQSRSRLSPLALFGRDVQIAACANVDNEFRRPSTCGDQEMTGRLAEVLQTGLLVDQNPFVMIAIFVALHVVCAGLFLPCSPFTILAGCLWGIFPGVIISIAAAAAASAMTFALGRWARSLRAVRNFLATRIPGNAYAALTDRMQLGWLAIFAIQINPIVPASSAGYLFGACGVRFSSYMTASMVAAVPAQIVIVTTSATVTDAVASRQITTYTIVLLVACSIALLLWLPFRLRQRSTPTGALSRTDKSQ